MDSFIAENFRLTERQKKALEKLGLKTLRDLLFYFPSRYESFSERKNIANLQEGDKTTVYGTITKAEMSKSWRKKMAYSQITIGDMTGEINAVWFHQPYISKMLKAGDKIALTGKIGRNKSGLCVTNPNYEKISAYEALGKGSAILAVYPETAGITSRWLRYAIQKILKDSALKISNGNPWINDPIPQEILNQYHLPQLKSAIIFIHAPKKISDAEAARKRFAFEEVFFIQLSRLKQKNERDKKDSFIIKITDEELEDFLSVFPFELTPSQKKSTIQIIEDMRTTKPMSRLLEGDVGSGKTAVAVSAVFAITKNEFQAAYMAPTEILAQQHFQSFINYFSQLRLTTKIGLITSSECKKYPSKVSASWRTNEATHISKTQLLKWVANGEIPILIGTHSLIQNKVKFQNLALVIIDEQHRFGTKQRAILASGKSERIPHLLSMTATPIPRTLALTIYSDLDLSLLDEMPAGRQKIITKIVEPQQRASAYEQIREELRAGRQAYIICPRIAPTLNSEFNNEVGVPTAKRVGNEPDKTKQNALIAKAVKEEAKRLKKEVFPEFEIGILHGKMLPKEKEEILDDFRNNKIQILVATSVVEVGIDIPNATTIIIEGAERFGLAQLHQLRGRVMRSNFQPYCFIFTESSSAKTKQRLNALVKAKNGFELAEYDLQFRGAGELGGGKQWGVSDLGMEALKNIKMVEAARAESQNLLKQDPELKNYLLILEKLKSAKNNIHFE